MRKDLKLVWFYKDDCILCDRLESQVVEFADAKGADLHRVNVNQDGVDQAEVPALWYSETGHRVFVGSFCLDALTWTLNEQR